MTATPRPTVTDWYTGRDSYGRTTHTAVTSDGVYGYHSLVGALVTLPRRTASVRPEGENYLVNLWGKNPDGRGEVTYHRTLKAAKAYFATHALTRHEYQGVTA